MSRVLAWCRRNVLLLALLILVPLVVAAGSIFVISQSRYEAPPVSQERLDAVNEQTMQHVVDYYDQICRSTQSSLLAEDSLEEAREDSLGEDPSSRSALLRSVGTNTEPVLAQGIQELRDASEPTSVALLTQRHPMNYSGAKDSLLAALENRQEVLSVEIPRLYENASTKESFAEAADKERELLDSSYRGLMDSLGTLLEKAPIPSEATRLAVAELPDCDRIIPHPSAPDEDEVIAAAVEFHVELCQLHQNLDSITDRLQEVDSENLFGSELYGAFSREYRATSAMLGLAADRLDSWNEGDSPDAATLWTTRHYDAARRSVTASLRDAQERTLRASDQMLSAADSSSASQAQELHNHAVLDSYRALARANRLAQLPNSASQEAVHRQCSS